MKPQVKRLVLKTTLLAVMANGALLYTANQEHGGLTRHDYLLAGASFGCTMVLIALAAFALNKWSKP